jgi:hypothetical protein
MSTRYSLIVFALLLAFVEGYSTGAAGCGKSPSVAGEHVDTKKGKRKVFSLKWTDRALNLTVDGVTIKPNSTINLVAGKVLEIKLVGKKIKGSLFRLSGTPITYNFTESLTTGIQTKIATNCKSYPGGLTHFSSAEKVALSGSMKFDEPLNINLDMTVVFMNNSTRSEYTYGQFKFRVCKKTTCSFLGGLFGCRPKCVYLAD